MSIPCFFIEDGAPDVLGLLLSAQSQSLRDDCVVTPEVVSQTLTLTLPKDVIDHMHTLRLRAGEHIVLVDAPGHGLEFELITAANKKTQQLEVRLLGEHTSTPPLQLTLVQGISTADRMDQTIRQATELGVSRIIPLESARSTVQLTGTMREKKRERWQRIARCAAEQSGQLRKPQIEPPVGLAVALELLKDQDVLLFFWEEEGGSSLAETLAEGVRGMKKPRVALFIGPEGGFSVAEAECINAVGAKTVTLGKAILRTETAAVVASALVLYQLGALGGS